MQSEDSKRSLKNRNIELNPRIITWLIPKKPNKSRIQNYIAHKVRIRG